VDTRTVSSSPRGGTMEFKNRYPGIDKYAVRFIKFKARQLVGKAGFTESDREDLEQELVIDLLNRLPKYRQSLAKRTTFINRIVRNKIITIIESRKAAIRDYRLHAYSLNECQEDSDGNDFEYIDNLNQDDYCRRTGRSSQSQEELQELSIDLGRIIAELPPEFQSLCKRLQEETVSEISRTTGIPRGTIYESIKKLKPVFEKAGLKNYFD
jgi:RNA polymerase sigma-70 factor (ECF subfamily)